MHLFSADTIPMPEITLKTEVREKSDTEAVAGVAAGIHRWIEQESQLITIKDDDEMHKRINHSRRQTGSVNPKFECMNMASEVLKRMKTMPFTHVYVLKIDKREKGHS